MSDPADYTDMSARPRASVIVTAYNLDRYLPEALDSALAQESPGGPVQIIVVDDGSTDNTPDVLAAYADRVEVIRQENGGLVKAVDAGLGAVRGEYIALLDADDIWPLDRLRRHVELLDANPHVGLVHGDMEVIDADGATLHPSFFTWKQDTPSNGRVLARLVKDNFVSGGASTFRASLMPAIWPIPADAAYPDWWIATNIAAVSEILYDPANANRYRYHGGNMGLGADRTAVLAIERRELPYRRWAMRNLTADETIDLRSLSEIVMRWRAAVGHSALSNDGTIRGILPRDEQSAAAELATAAAHPVGLERCRALVRALSHDPLDGATSIDLDVAFLQASELHAPPAPLAQPLTSLQTRPVLVLAWLDDLVSRPELLHDFARESLARDDLTLAILTADGVDLSGLIALVEADPALNDERCDLRVIAEPGTWPAQRLLAARASATLTAAGAPAGYVELPAHGAMATAQLAA
jgi:glycosyltransferase involved in cell wall biosynthesis